MKFISREIKKEARTVLSGKWKKVAIITLLFTLINSFFSIAIYIVDGQKIYQMIVSSEARQQIKIPIVTIVLSILQLLINIPLIYGMIKTFTKIKRNEDAKITDFITLGFKKYFSAFVMFFRIFVKIAVAFVVPLLVGLYYLILDNIIGIIFCIISVVVGVIISYVQFLTYSLSYNVLYDNPKIKKKKDILEKCEKMMEGNRVQYFVLMLSFIGWAILSILTCGIGFMWLIPYIVISCICFYDKIKVKE